MDGSVYAPEALSQILMVPAGEDQFGAFKTLGISQVAFKVSSRESKDIFMVEITLRKRGGPAKHLHYNQDEWWYIVESEFIIEAGDKRFHLKPGDSLWVPRKIPHAWAFVGETQGRFIASVSPAGKLEEFFLAASKNNALPGPDQNQWRPYDMEWVGPPLKID